MYVYIVIADETYVGGTIQHIFSNEADAKACAKEMNEDPENPVDIHHMVRKHIVKKSLAEACSYEGE